MVAVRIKLLLSIYLLDIVAVCCIQASNETLTEGPETTESVLENAEDEFLGKHEDFVNCFKFFLDPDEYVIYPNATVYVKDYNRSYTEEFYILDGGLLQVCIPTDDDDELKNYDPTHTLASTELQTFHAIGVGISIVCLVIHLVVFALVPDLRNEPGCNMASMCASLFLSYVSMIVALADAVHRISDACVVAAGFLQFFLLASFFWMFVIAFDVFKSICQATKNLRAASASFKVKRFLYNNLMAWGGALIFTAAAMIVDNIEGVPETFQPQFEVICWFNQKNALLVFFGGPVIIAICTNFILFGISSYKIASNQMKSNSESQQSKLRRNHVMYFRLAIIMGVTWITAALAPIVNQLWLWFIFAAANAFQGFYIFVGFTCTHQVRKYLRIKFFGEKIPKKSLTPTFQSYLVPGNSTGNDINKKEVNSTSGSEVIAAIHL